MRTNNASCRNYCEATGECLMEAINRGDFNGENVFRLTEYIRGPRITDDLTEYHQEQMEAYYEPENPDFLEEYGFSEFDTYVEEINATLATNEEPFYSYSLDESSLVSRILEPFEWRRGGIHCAREGVNFMVSTTVDMQGTFHTTTRRM